MSRTFYNDNDKKAAAWLGELVAQGHVSDGDVDTRSIADLTAADVQDRERVHLFAGIGGWDYALKLAGWPEEVPVWTGSCPCQPFSSAGKGKGVDDERHLWPEMRRLIEQGRPALVFGEQVASKAGREWFGGKQGLQRVRDAQNIVGVLQEFIVSGGLPDEVQRLLSGRGERKEEAQEPEGSERSPQSVPQNEKGVRPCPGCEVPCGQERCSFHSGRERHSRAPGDDRHWGVRVDGDSVQPGRRQDVGQPLPGQDRQRDGVRAGECSRGPLLRQCDGERVGGGQGCRDCGRHLGKKAVCVCRLAKTLGEVSEAASRYQDFAGVQADLEALGYAVGAADVCAAGVGAPHIRQRLWWVAYARCRGLRDIGRQLGGTQGGAGEEARQQRFRDDAGDGGDAGGLVHAEHGRQAEQEQGEESRQAGDNRWLGDAEGSGAGLDERRVRSVQREAGFWSDFDLVACRDGKARRVEPGTFPLAHGVPARVGRLRGYGNAIVPQVAAEFIAAFMEATA